MNSRTFGIGAALLAATALLLPGQEYRGSITGQVVDPQGAAIARAEVTVVNVETNTTVHTASNDTGRFAVNLLNPGTYQVTVEMPGFRKSVRSGLTLSVAGRLDLELRLEVGGVTETVEVTAEAPLLDTTTASGGRVIDQQQIMQLPFADNNPFALATLAAGMQWTGQPEYRLPYAVAGTSSFNTMGAVGSNEYTMDGAPITGSDRRIGYVPPSDAVGEFKLETTTFDASYGHTSGASMNVMSKAGTNKYHGTLYNQHWQQRWNATPHFTRLAWENAVRKGTKKASDPKQPSGRSNNFGATLGGPVRLPKVYNGRDKLFFFFSYNGIYQDKVETTSSVNKTVPKMAWRDGDFSDLLAVDARRYTIYDPRSARSEGSRVVRTPFPGNKGIPVLNPMYDFYTKLYPRPNDVPGLVSPEGINNYHAAGMPHSGPFNSYLSRLDYNISDRQRMFGRWNWSDREGDADDWTYETMRGLHSTGLTKISKGAGGSYLWTVSNSTVLDVGASWNRYSEGSRNEIPTQFKPTDVGLPAYLDEKSGDYHILPRINFSNIATVASSEYPVIGQRGATAELKVGVVTLSGNHSFKYGWQERRYWYTSLGPGYPSGMYSFNNSFMRSTDADTTASSHGLEWAAFRMAAMTGARVDSNDSGYYSTRFRALYLQDDWRLSKRLRLNLGLRYEREGGITERFNRGIGGEFLYDAPLPFTDLVQAAYARDPLAELPASAFKVLGGAPYLGIRHKTFTNGTHHWLPRAGVVVQADSRTVIRGGYGWYYDTFNANNTRPEQYGYSQPTYASVTTDNGLSFCCGVGAAANLSASRNPVLDPFPVRADGTRFDTPYGNRLGLLSAAGRGRLITPRDYNPAWQQRWRIGFQREIMGGTVLEMSYNGSASRIPVDQKVNYLPEQYWATGNVRVQATDDDMNRNVPNPFHYTNLAPLQASDPLLYKYLSSQTFFTSKTIRKHQLLRPFPHITSLTGVRPGVSFADSCGGARYHDLELQLERRLSKGFQTTVIYTRAYSTKQNEYRNEFDPAPAWRSDNAVRPHRFVWSAIWELPFGRRRAWITSGPVQHLVGGWQLSWIYQYQSGAATSWSNRFFYGDLQKLGDLFAHESTHARDIHMWFNPSIAYRGTGAIPSGFQGFEGRSAMQPGQYHVRVFPSVVDALRADGIRNWDVKLLRQFRVNEQLRTVLSVDLLNATNHTNFEGPNTDPSSTNFGRVTSQRGLSRIIQFNLRVEF